MKKVNVHIVTYNSQDDIAECLMAVLEQTYPVHQIIVIDNQSQDNTVQVLHGLQDRGITVVANQENNGFAGGHNQAIRMADPEVDYYLVLNPDVKLHPDYVVSLVRAMEKDPAIGSATGMLVFTEHPTVIDSTGLRINKARRAFDRGQGEAADRWNQKDEVFGVSGAAAFYSSRMVRDISVDGEFYDEDFFAYKEDVDVAWRSLVLGWKALYVPEAKGFHRRGWKKGTRGAIPLRIRRYSYINRYKMMLKNDRLLEVLKQCIPLLMYELPSLLYFLVKEPQVLGAWKSVWSKWSQIRRKRAFIQSRRKSEWKEIYRYFE
ncbi:glycosyltransferase family 2 protein [Paenibacillus caseinilyticus]|uniref:Glycosyl transferase n=1 Tax=Paenibacillus mucilaginosus K02 TaxID=997761 RepID=I0BBD2_9BACL|nr:glycosyltransferase family 2 protein [Paenibacillus mucilaginosus]AFH59679.1 glycosyl transferase [Paenibacillus mucilaginosus K02]AFK65470.1 uncharacterized glycosyltransferase ydaM [Paenibacillus mucilaginosus K02]